MKRKQFYLCTALIARISSSWTHEAFCSGFDIENDEVADETVLRFAADIERALGLLKEDTSP